MDTPGEDGVAADAMGEEIFRDGVGHGEHRAFAGGVGETVGDGRLSDSAGEIQDGAAALRGHVPQRSLGAVGDAVDVHALDSCEVLGRGGEGVADMGDAGVVHEDVQACVPREDTCKGGVHRSGLADIATLAVGAVAGGAKFGHGGIERGLLEVEDFDLSSMRGEALGDGESDAGCASGNDGGFVGEVEGGGVHGAWFS